MDISEIFLGFFGVAFIHSAVSLLFPCGGADFTMQISVLIGRNESRNFVNITSDGEIVLLHVSKYTLVVNDVGSSQGFTASVIATIVRGNRLIEISNNGVVEFANTSLFTFKFLVSTMGKFGIHGYTNNLTVHISR
jgi:hypothetical protein